MPVQVDWRRAARWAGGRGSASIACNVCGHQMIPGMRDAHWTCRLWGKPSLGGIAGVRRPCGCDADPVVFGHQPMVCVSAGGGQR